MAVTSRAARPAWSFERDLQRGWLRVYVLERASEGPVCGKQLSDDLRARGRRSSPGVLYPLLAQLVSVGYLARSAEADRERRWYRATPKGKTFLSHVNDRVIDLANTLVPER